MGSQVLEETNVLEAPVDCRRVMVILGFRTMAPEGGLLLVSRRDSRPSPSEKQLKCLPSNRATPADLPLPRQIRQRYLGRMRWPTADLEWVLP